MSRDTPGLRDAASLREAFDRAFAEPVAPAAAGGSGFLLVGVGDDAYALRVGDVAEVASGLRVVPLPSADDAFVGLVGLRGALVPVFALGVLLGHARARGAPRWLVLSRHDKGTYALGLDRADGFASAGPDDVVAAEGHDARTHVREVLRHGGRLHPVLDLASLSSHIDGRVTASRKEE